MQVAKTAFLDPGNPGKTLKPNFVKFIEGSADHLLSVNVKILFKFQVNVVAIILEETFKEKNMNLRFLLFTSAIKFHFQS